MAQPQYHATGQLVYLHHATGGHRKMSGGHFNEEHFARLSTADGVRVRLAGEIPLADIENGNGANGAGHRSESPIKYFDLPPGPQIVVDPSSASMLPPSLFQPAITATLSSLDKRSVRQATVEMDDGVYTGMLKGPKRHGAGEQVWNHGWRAGEVYAGDWDDNTIQGRGIYTYLDGVYEGEWKDGKHHGKGTYQWSAGIGAGSTYEGEWVRGKREGRGSWRAQSGDTYVGEWGEDARTGHGTATYVNGDLYEGAWLRGEYSGKGKYFSSTGGHYEGEWAHGTMHGFGEYTWSTGRVFRGLFEHGRPQEGLLSETDDEVFRVEFSGVHHVTSIHLMKDLLLREPLPHSEKTHSLRYSSRDSFRGLPSLFTAEIEQDAFRHVI